MDFNFQGFQSLFPIWIYLLIFIGTSLLAWWSYKEYKSIGKKYRYLLIFLRSAVFFILLLLLINPYIKTEQSYLENPNILVLLDNTDSTGIEKNSYKGTESYQKVLDTLDFEDSSSTSFNFYTIGNNVRSSKLDSLTFDEQQTNLAQSIEVIKANESDATAAILISDGIYTRGQNPVFEVGNANIPVFTVALGDTTSKKDVFVRSVSSNSTGYLNSRQPVEASVTSNGFQGESFQVQLRDGNQILSSKTVTPELTNSTQDLQFELLLNEEGLQQYEITIPELTDEWTSDNNTQRFSVNVEDAKQNILSLAFEVHPDVKFIRSLLSRDNNTNLTKHTWLKGNRFIEGGFNPDPDSVDLVIVHGYPRSGLSPEVEEQLSDLVADKPFITTATPLFDTRRYEEEIASLPVSVTGPWNYSSVAINPVESSASHPIMELPNISYERLPPLSAPIQNIDLAPGATSLFNSMYQGRNTDKPVLIIQEVGNKRIAFLAAFGWFHFEQNNNAQIQEFGRELLLNIVSWTATDPDNQLLEVEPVQTTFSGSENVVINAYLTNERDEVEPNASIGITVSSDTTDSRHYSMENIGSGRYRLNLGKLPEGIYSFKATARKEDRTIESREGEFAVSQSNAEFINVVRNDNLLRQIAERSGGHYFSYDSVSGFWETLDQRDLLEQNQKTNTSFFYLYQHYGWFLVVIVLLTAEWIIRKYYYIP